MSTRDAGESYKTRPVRNETYAEKVSRLEKEAEANRVSDAIDKKLYEDGLRARPSASEYRMLLLGQAGAGKTTVLKQMRLLYDPETHHRGRGFWREIVYLNLVTSLRILLQVLPALQEKELQVEFIWQFEQRMRRSLKAVGDGKLIDDDAAFRGTDVAARHGDTLLLRAGWQDRSHTRSQSMLLRSREMLQSLQDHVQRLWSEPRCRGFREKLEAADGMTYFLDNYARICVDDYEPSDQDILHTRVRTIGVTEHRFRVDRHLVYRIFDVGGSRNQRAAWTSFFDDAQAIIFLAPLSVFDQCLAEDASVNRVQDSLDLFAQIAACDLLKQAALILFLNKMDLLEKKLQSGIQLSHYFRDYDGDNDYEAVWRWFRFKFRAIVSNQRSVAPQRPVYVHTTIATSTKQIRAILTSVKDTILRDNLRATGLVG